MGNFSFSTSTNLVEESKWLLAVTSFEATNTVSTISDKKNSFSNTIPSYWSSRGCAETIKQTTTIIKI